MRANVQSWQSMAWCPLTCIQVSEHNKRCRPVVKPRCISNEVNLTCALKSLCREQSLTYATFSRMESA